MDYVFIFVLGAVIGSFLNVVIYRLPKNKSIVTPSSMCPNCNTKIKPWHNIPILSFVFLKGKCAYCGEKISPVYPFVELLSALLAVFIYSKTDFDLFFVTTYSVFASLLALSIIDLRYKAVPDSLNLFALTLSIFNSPEIVQNLQNALILMGGMSAIRFYVSYFVKQEAMGEGDIIVAGTMGALVGVKLSLIALFIASLTAIFPSLYNRIKNNDFELPFIPFLAFGLFIVWYFSDYFTRLWDVVYG